MLYLNLILPVKSGYAVLLDMRETLDPFHRIAANAEGVRQLLWINIHITSSKLLFHTPDMSM